jgi:hypothetical protein
MRGTELLSCIHAPTGAAQPFPVEQMRAGLLRADLAAAQSVDRLEIQLLGDPIRRE